LKSKFPSKGFILSAAGAVLAVLCGFLLLKAPVGDPWSNASYDYLFRFSARPVTNNVVLILMDNLAFNQFHQTRGQPWDRALHAQLLNKLADDGCALVVFDSFFRGPRDKDSDDALVAAMRRQRNIVLMAEQAEVTHPDLIGAQPILPAELFLAAARTNWGVAWLDVDLDSVVRRHWPFPSPGPYPDLAWRAAQLYGVEPGGGQQERWLRYYGENGASAQMSYSFALIKPKNYFRGKTIFIGTQPQTPMLGDDPDEFSTPFTRWTGESSGGVNIILTEFLNLVNSDWLRRLPSWMEVSILAVTGILTGFGFCRMKFPAAAVSAVAIAVAVSLVAVSWSYFTNYWFPWLIIVGGQVPCALAWAAAVKTGRKPEIQSVPAEKMPVTPGYRLFHPPIGKGAYGKVWLAQNTNGQWRALKVIYLENFDGNATPYDREFNGISRFKLVSDGHPGLLPIDFVSEKSDGYFFYVMELGDSLTPDWNRDPGKYRPHDLAAERARQPGQRLPLRDCIRITIALADALEFLHQRDLTHRDIKPQNVIFVNGQPKLADLGLVAEIRLPDQTKTFVGTPGYMPPPPEPPGTPQADIYALGMLLYVISTGRNASFFPEIATTLVNANQVDNFLPLNAIILKACHPDQKERYKSAAEMRQMLCAITKS
jgi:CHASE2 domain-containing sensor protein